MSVTTYNAIYSRSAEYRKPYRQSVYYPVWNVAADSVHGRVLDIGCGPGQFGELMRDRGITDYTGIDISSVAVKMAQAKGLNCHVKDVFTMDLAGYDTITMLEVLEHIENDIQLIEMIPAGTNIVFSVPDFWSATHVRVYKSANEILKRYSMLKIKAIHPFKLSNSTIYLCLA